MRKKGVGHAAFEMGFIWWGLLFSVCGGLLLASLFSISQAFDIDIFENIFSYTYLHAHLQIIGFAGSFIIPISLHFIPRLAGVPLSPDKIAGKIKIFFVASIFLHFVSAVFLPYTSGLWARICLGSLIVSSIFFIVAICLYIFAIFRVIKIVNFHSVKPALPQVAVFFFMTLAGWVFYGAINLSIILKLWFDKTVIFDGRWQLFSADLFIGFVLFPISFAFAIRTFPLYLRLPAADWQVRNFSVIFFLIIFCNLLLQVPIWPPGLHSKLQPIVETTTILRNFLIFWFIWKLDVLTRCRQTWLQKYELVSIPNRKPTRPGMPDYGEFGRFELLIYAAFFWLLCGIVIQIFNSFIVLITGNVLFPAETIRHIYLLGFIGNLIFGMAPRMIPAFLGIKRIKQPALVPLGFFLINFAAIGRIFPRLFPAVCGRTGELLYGASGVLALLAVITLWVMLYQTIARVQQTEKPGRK